MLNRLGVALNSEPEFGIGASLVIAFFKNSHNYIGIYKQQPLIAN